MSADRDRLVAIIEEIAHAARSGDTASWENVSLADYLEALAAWVSVYEHAYINTGRPVPDNVWDVWIAAVRAATTYE